MATDALALARFALSLSSRLRRHLAQTVRQAYRYAPTSIARQLEGRELVSIEGGDASGTVVLATPMGVRVARILGAAPSCSLNARLTA